MKLSICVGVNKGITPEPVQLYNIYTLCLDSYVELATRWLYERKVGIDRKEE